MRAFLRLVFSCASARIVLLRALFVVGVGTEMIGQQDMRLFANPVSLESAVLGNTGLFGGTSITSQQYVGWRFAIDEPLIVQHVGGHLLAFEPGGIFAAFVSLPSLDAVPQGAPFTAQEVVAHTRLSPGLPSSEWIEPFGTVLEPGNYALVFGTNLFGATGAGAIPNPVDQPDIPPTTIDSYLFWGTPGFGLPPQWRESLASHMRFIVRGITPGSADFDSSGSINSVDFGRWQAGFQSGSGASRATGDADLDQDVDGGDFLMWQQQRGYVAVSGSMPLSVPEASQIWSLLSVVILAFPRRGWGRETPQFCR